MCTQDTSPKTGMITVAECRITYKLPYVKGKPEYHLQGGFNIVFDQSVEYGVENYIHIHRVEHPVRISKRWHCYRKGCPIEKISAVRRKFIEDAERTLKTRLDRKITEHKEWGAKDGNKDDDVSIQFVPRPRNIMQFIVDFCWVLHIDMKWRVHIDGIDQTALTYIQLPNMVKADYIPIVHVADMLVDPSWGRYLRTLPTKKYVGLI